MDWNRRIGLTVLKVSALASPVLLPLAWVRYRQLQSQGDLSSTGHGGGSGPGGPGGPGPGGDGNGAGGSGSRHTSAALTAAKDEAWGTLPPFHLSPLHPYTPPSTATLHALSFSFL